MAKFKKALALVLSLAMVLTLAPIANVQTKAASKYKIKAATTAIAAGKTYNVKVTGVTKKQYVKISRTAGVTVKYKNGSKLTTIKASKKVAGTGKTLVFKVTAPGKEKAYNTVIKALIYNKSTNKKVKTLSTKRKIKALPVEELSIKSVEMADNAGYYLDVVFGKALKSLSTADVAVRDAATNQLSSVESAVLASDGLTARIAMAGATTAGGADAALLEGVKYTLTVTQNGKIASNTFEVAAVRSNALVQGYNVKNKTINLSTAWNARANPAAMTAAALGNLRLSDKVAETIDYEDLLGRTVSVWMNSSNEITKIVPATQTVVYDHVGVVKAANGTVTVTGSDGKTTYSFEETTTTNSSIRTGEVVDHALLGAANANLFTAAAGVPGTWGTTSTAYTYAKLVLNADGKIQSMICSDAPTTVYLTSEVSGNTIKCGGTTLSLADYTIIKEGKLIAVSDIVKGDIVVVYAADKMAEIYTQSVKGTVTAAYADRFVLGDKTYKFSGFSLVYATAANGQNAATVDYLSGLVTAKTEVTLYLDRSGAARFISGEGTTVNNTEELVVTTSATGYAVGSNHYISFKAFDGKAINTYNITCEDLTAVTDVKGNTVKPSSTVGLSYNDDDTPATAPSAWGSVSADTYYLYSGSVGVVLSDIKAGQLVTITKGASDKIVGLNLTWGISPATADVAIGTGTKAIANMAGGGTSDASWDYSADAFKLGSNAAVAAGALAATDTIYDGKSTTVALKGTTYSIASSTPVYQLTAAGTGFTATKGEYSKSVGAIKAAATATVDYYVTSTGNKVSAIVLRTNLNSNITTVRGLVIDKIKDGSGNIVSVTVIKAPKDGESKGEVKTYEANANGKDDDVTIGSVYDLSIDSDSKYDDDNGAIAANAAYASKLIKTIDGAGTITLGDTAATVVSKATSVTPFFIKVSGTTYTAIELSDIHENDSITIWNPGTTQGTAASTQYEIILVNAGAGESVTIQADKTTNVGLGNTTIKYSAVHNVAPVVATGRVTYAWTFTQDAAGNLTVDGGSVTTATTPQTATSAAPVITWDPTAAGETLTATLTVTGANGAVVAGANWVLTSATNVANPTGGISVNGATTTLTLTFGTEGLYKDGAEIANGSTVAFTATGGDAVAGNAVYDSVAKTLTFTQVTTNFDAATDQVTFTLTGYTDSLGNAYGTYTATYNTTGPALDIA